MLNGANAEFNGTSAEFIDAAPDHDYSLQKRMGQRHLKGLKRDKSGPRLQKPAHVVPQPQTQTDEPVNLKRKDEREKYYHDG
ncbi:MAG: hypothetical protein JSR17_09270, partial [Proteobacteria bacterium]|nr:hypothetical protein [Pseudomonadota bacterium]